jgi:hypothetical protein
VGGASALAVDYWPHYATIIQMSLFTIMVFGPLLLGLWPQRTSRFFWMTMSAAVIAHGAFLYAIRETFPFSTVLIVVPIALLEAATLFVAIDKVFGNQNVES